MKLNSSALKTKLDYPFIWIRNFFEASLLIPLQILSLRDWEEYNGEIDGHFEKNYKCNVPRTATELRKFIQIIESEEIVEFVSRVSGKEVELFDLSFQNFINNDYLVADVNQDITLTLFVSHWKPTWGGIVEFRKTEIWGAVATPIFGSALLQLPDSEWLSQITKIEPEAPVSRISVVLRFCQKNQENRGNRLTLSNSDV